jgi:hypothetical protein
MKPTSRMLGKLSAPTSDASAKHESRAEAATTVTKVEDGAKVTPGKEKPAPGELLKRVKEIAEVLEKMSAPPELGVRAKASKDNVPSKEAWTTAREHAVKRLKALAQRVKAESEARDKGFAPAAKDTSGGLVEEVFTRELDRMTSALEVPPPPKKER